MTPHLIRTNIPLLATLACLVLMTLVVADSGSAATPSSHASRTCEYPPYYAIGASQGYFRQLRATNVSCAFGVKLIKAYQRCRNPTGKRPRGTCKKRVLRFRCSEGRRTFSDDGAGGYADFSAKVTCRRGDQRVIHVYQQDL